MTKEHEKFLKWKKEKDLNIKGKSQEYINAMKAIRGLKKLNKKT